MQRLRTTIEQGQTAFKLFLLFLSLAVFLPQVSQAATIAGAEYFYDIDPGEGNGIGLNAADGSFDSSEENVDITGVDTSSLKIGSHTLYLRFMNDQGVWGIARPLSYDSDFASPTNFKIIGYKWIIAAEYYFDSDSANSHPVLPADGQYDQAQEKLLLNNINLAGLAPGEHTLTLRLMDNEGSWGIARQINFEVYTPHTITGAEYYFDADPGPGQGTVLAPQDGDFNSSDEAIAPTQINTSLLSVGVHSLHVRFKDEFDRWGAGFSQSIAVGKPVAFSRTVPVLTADGSGEVPLSVVVSDYTGLPCQLKIEYQLHDGGEWYWATVKPGSIVAEKGAVPGLDNTAEYQIGTAGHLIDTASGKNNISFIWNAAQDLVHSQSDNVVLRFTISNGSAGATTSSLSSSFPVDLISPDVPTIYFYYPDPTADPTPHLKWRWSSYANTFQVQVAIDPDFTNLLIDQSSLPSTEFTPATPLAMGDVYWRVRAVDTYGNESPWSLVDHFSIVNDAVAPSVTLSYSETEPMAAGPLTITAVFSEDLVTIPEISISMPGTNDIAATPMQGSGAIWHYAMNLPCADTVDVLDGIATISVSGGFDSAGNENTLATNNTFTINTSACGSGIITGAEYFFDNDPGLGNGIAALAADGAFDSAQEILDLSGIDISGLKIGSHTLYARFKSADGIWGVARPIGNDTDYATPVNFRISGEKYLVGGECFIDADPGEGNGLPVSAADGIFDEPYEEITLPTISLAGMASGEHILYLRLQDNEGSWGVVRQINFETHDPQTITAAEYFIDDDLGPGQNSRLAAKDGRFDSNLEQVELAGIDTTTLTEGVHYLGVRYRDQKDRWGVALSRPFAINRPLSFSSSVSQPATGDGLVPLSITVADQSGANCRLKIEFFDPVPQAWQNITVVPGSVYADYGTPQLDNNAPYQIGGAGGWVETGSGVNTVNLVWDSMVDASIGEVPDMLLRFTIDNGTSAHITNTESLPFSLDVEEPDIPTIIYHQPDPTADTKPLLEWHYAEGATSYRIEIATDSSFTNIIVDQNQISQKWFRPFIDLPVGDIYWRVVAVDGAGNESYYSLVDHFVIAVDQVLPSVTLSYSRVSPVGAGPLIITAEFSEPVVTVPVITIDRSGGDVVTAAMKGAGATWHYTYPVNCADGINHVDGNVQVTVSNGFDDAGHENSAAVNNVFSVDTSNCGAQIITEAEYFFDTDPGEGNGTLLDAADGAYDSPEESVNLTGIDTSGLLIGHHTLYCRFKSSEGVWGIARPIAYDGDFASPVNLRVIGNKWLVGAEYYIDSDPGAGNGTSLNAKDGVFDEPEEDFELVDIDLSAFDPGTHTVFVRALDNEGSWGIIYQKQFEIYTPQTIAGAEYFIDVDPGPGNGQFAPALDGRYDSANEQVNLDAIDISSLADGVHELFIRFRDKLGRWGALSSQPFAVNKPVAFSGLIQQPSPGDGNVLLQITVADQSGANSMLKVEYDVNDADNWQNITIQTGSLSAGYGSPFFDGTAPYQIGSAAGWIETGNGPNHLSFTWLSGNDLGSIMPDKVRLRFTINNGTDETSTISRIYSWPFWTLAASNDSYIDITPYSYQFDDTSVGYGSVLQQFTVMVKGDSGNLRVAPLQILNPVTGTASADYVVDVGSDTCSGNILAPGENCTFAVQFTPNLTGNIKGEITVCADGVANVCSPVVRLNGTGILPDYSLNVTTIGNGSGTVTDSVYGIDCGGTCSAVVQAGQSVDLTAAPADSSNFIGWSGPCSGTGVCSFSISADTNVTGAFQLKTFAVTGSAAAGTGSIICTPNTVEYGADASCTIQPAAGYHLDSLTDNGVDITSGLVGNTYSLNNVTNSHTLAAVFVNSPPLFTAISDQNAIEGQLFTYTAQAVDPENSTVQYSLISTIAGMSIDSATGQIQWMPVYSSVGIHTVRVRAVDQVGASADISFQITVAFADQDGDGLPDTWELQYYNDLNTTATDDTDGDGFTTMQEYLAGTNPTSLDSDGDGIPDTWEIDHGLDVNGADADLDPDSDGLTNLQEYQYGTDPHNSDTDGDGMSDGDEVSYGSDPLVAEGLGFNLQEKMVTVSLQGHNSIYILVANRGGETKYVDINISGLDGAWLPEGTVIPQMEIAPFFFKIISFPLQLPFDCSLTTGEYPFTVTAHWQTVDNNGDIKVQGGLSDSGTLTITPEPSVFPIATSGDKIMAGNKIFTAWKTDIPTTSSLFYRQIGTTEFIEVAAGTDTLMHEVVVPDLEYGTYYEFYTDNIAACGGRTTTELQRAKTGKAVKFVDGVNEFWVDRDYNQPVTLTITNTDVVAHTYDLSVINDNSDIVVGFVGEGSQGRTATLQPGEAIDVDLRVNAANAEKTDYDIYLKMDSDSGKERSFVDFSHAIIHVRPFVANLDLQPVQSEPGMMTSKFRLMNYGDTLDDIEIYVDDASAASVILNPSITHARLQQGEFVEFTIQASEYVSGTVYARSGSYESSAPFEIGCPAGTNLNAYTLQDFTLQADVQDWYCTNETNLDLPFNVPKGLSLDNIGAAWLNVDFQLPMALEKYDPHTVHLLINGTRIATIADQIPSGSFSFRFPPSLIHLAKDDFPQNILSVDVDGMNEGQYIVVTNFKVFMDVRSMEMNLCVPPKLNRCDLPDPPPECFPPPPETRIIDIGPNKKFRPGQTVPLSFELQNDDVPNYLTGSTGEHSGRLTVTITNNSGNGIIPTQTIYRDIIVPPGDWFFVNSAYKDEHLDKLDVASTNLLLLPDQDEFLIHISEDADDIDYTVSITFEDNTIGSSVSRTNSPDFWIRRPLIIVHGMMGSELYDSSTGKAAFSPSSLFLSQCDNSFGWLKCNNEGQGVTPTIGPTKVISELLKMPIFGYEFAYGSVFRGLLDNLKARRYEVRSYGLNNKENFSSFVHFPDDSAKDIIFYVYDWRNKNSDSAVGLKSLIDNFIRETGVNKVNILAHSMGGLVTKAMFNATPAYVDKVHKVFFVGTPHLGSPNAFTALRYGMTNPTFLSAILHNSDEIVQRIDEIKTKLDLLLTGMPSGVEPSADLVVSDFISFLETLTGEQCIEAVELAKRFKTLTEAVSMLAGDIGEIPSLLNDLYEILVDDQDFDFMRDQWLKTISANFPSVYELLPSREYFVESGVGYFTKNGFAINDYDSMTNLMPNLNLYSSADALHADLDNSSLSLPTSYVIGGCRVPTETSIKETTGLAGTTFLDFSRGDGDGTVPLTSGMAGQGAKKYAVQYGKHMGLPSNSGTISLVDDLLKGLEPSHIYNVSNSVQDMSLDDGAFCGLQPGWKINIVRRKKCTDDLPWEICYPLIYIPPGDGGKGTDIVTSNGLELGILGSDYRFTNDGIEIFVPDGAAYTMQFHGVDREYLNIKFQKMTEGGVVKTYIYYNLPVDLADCGEVVFDLKNAMTDPVLRIDQQCDGSFEQTGIAPTYILDENQSNDFIPPVTVPTISGTLGANNWYTSDVAVSLNAQDNTGGSGVLITKYRFQDDLNFYDYSGPISITTPGTYQIYYYSLDKNLNKEIEQSVEIKVDQTTPSITELNDSGLFSMGLANFTATWVNQVGMSGLQDVRYSIGTSPGAANVVGWQSIGLVNSVNRADLSLSECSVRYFVNVESTGNNGLTSAVVSSDGVVALAPGADPDIDGYLNETELTAQSNPCSIDSYPKDNTIHIEKGFNLIELPAEFIFMPDLRDWLPLFGNSSEIEKIMVFNPVTGRYISMVPGVVDNPSFILSGGEGIIVYAKQPKNLSFTSALCTDHDLNIGSNFFGFSCLPTNYDSYQIMRDIGNGNISSIQRYNGNTGMFETTSFDPVGQPAGPLFLLSPEEGYLLNMKLDMPGFRP